MGKAMNQAKSYVIRKKWAAGGKTFSCPEMLEGRCQRNKGGPGKKKRRKGRSAAKRGLGDSAELMKGQRRGRPPAENYVRLGVGEGGRDGRKNFYEKVCRAV